MCRVYKLIQGISQLSYLLIPLLATISQWKCSQIALLMVLVVKCEECGQEEFTKCAEPLEMLNLSPKFSIGDGKKEDLNELCRCVCLNWYIQLEMWWYCLYISLSLRELHKGVRCIQSFTRRCMDLQQRNHFNTLYHGTNRFIKDLCTEGKFQDGMTWLYLTWSWAGLIANCLQITWRMQPARKWLKRISKSAPIAIRKLWYFCNQTRIKRTLQQLRILRQFAGKCAMVFQLLFFYSLSIFK